MGTPGSAIMDWLTGNSADDIANAAIRAKGIDPATNTWIGPQYDTGQDPAVVADTARQQAQAAYDAAKAQSDASIATQHAAAGGFVADLLNPFSPNIDPTSTTAKVANFITNPLAQLGIPASATWTIFLVAGFAVLFMITVHEVESL